MLAGDVINPAELSVTLEDIGGLNSIVNALVRAFLSLSTPWPPSKATNLTALWLAVCVTAPSTAPMNAVQQGDCATAASPALLGLSTPKAQQGRAAVRPARHGQDHAGQGTSDLEYPNTMNERLAWQDRHECKAAPYGACCALPRNDLRRCYVSMYKPSALPPYRPLQRSRGPGS